MNQVFDHQQPNIHRCFPSIEIDIPWLSYNWDWDRDRDVSNLSFSFSFYLILFQSEVVRLAKSLTKWERDQLPHKMKLIRKLLTTQGNNLSIVDRLSNIFLSISIQVFIPHLLCFVCLFVRPIAIGLLFPLWGEFGSISMISFDTNEYLRGDNSSVESLSNHSIYI